MIPLLELALDAHGGLTRWRQVKSIDLRLPTFHCAESQWSIETTHPTAHPRVYSWYLNCSFTRKYLLCNQGDSEGRLVRDQEAGGSNPLAPTNYLFWNH
jgi:hypothetical protein